MRRGTQSSSRTINMVLVLDPRNSSSHAFEARYILAGHPSRPRRGQYVLVGSNKLYEGGGTSDASRTRLSKVQTSLHDEGRSMDKTPQRDRLTIEQWNMTVASSQSSLSSSSSSLFDRRSSTCVKNLDAVFTSTLTSGRDTHKVQVKSTDTRDPTASNRENQSNASSCCRKNHAHGQSFRRKNKSHTESFSRRKGHGSSFRKVKVSAQAKSHSDPFRRKAGKGHDDSFQRKVPMKGREDSSRSGTKIRSAPELAYDSYRSRNSRTLFQQGVDIMLHASKKHP